MLLAKRFVLLLSVLSFMFVGCTRYANEQELKNLNDTKNAASKAEKKLSNLKEERRTLEDRLSEKENELKAAKEEKSAVETRLEESNN